ncbi:MAG: hypothetical protein E7640_03905 [Ruminococcaceae bacterium]|nr:hypothetical protein [Oscillospiraceae bacterium]
MQDKFYGILYGERFSDKEQSAYAVAHSLISGKDLLGARVTPETLSEFIKKKEFDGLIVSPEFGKTVMPLVSKTSPAARACGAVDTIVKMPDGRLYGENSSAFALSYIIEKVHPDPIEKCIVLGAGTDAAALKYIQSIKKPYFSEIVTVTEKGRNNFSNIGLHTDATLLINTLGTELPFSLDGLPLLRAVIDLNLNPIATPLVLAARARGIEATNGIPFAAAKILAANSLFFGVEADIDILAPVEAAIFSKHMSITLISTDESLAAAVAPRLSEAIGKKSFDIPSVIAKLYGKSLDEIKQLEGPKSNEFDRSLRVAVTWAGKKSGSVLVMPSDVTEKREYRAMLASNGPIIGIVRPDEDGYELERFCDLLVQIGSADEADIAVEAIRAELQI